MEAEPKPRGDERYQQVMEILGEALEMEPEARRAYLEEACGEDEELRQEVDSLLASSEAIGDDFISEPAIPRHADDVELDRESIGPYRLLKRLGAGGMGAVYLAERHEEFHQKVALKLIMRGLENDEIVRRFTYERQILASLQHPNIAHLLDGSKTDDGLPYFVMEYVEGQPIDRYCTSKGLSVDQRLELFRQVGEAVAFAHRSLVVHRDLKPANILVTEDGVPKLLDFGIAKLLNNEGGGVETELIRPLTTAYASPEQLAYQNVTTSSDIYSLGVLLYELLAGRRPFSKKESNPHTLWEVTRDVVPTAPSLVAGKTDARLQKRLAGDLDAIVLKALRPEPKERYPSVEQLLEDLDRYRQGLPVQAHRGSTLYRTNKFVRRNRAGVITVAVLALAAIIAGLLFSQAQAEKAERLREASLADSYGTYLISVFEQGNPDQGDTLDPVREEVVQEILADALAAMDDSLNDNNIARAVMLGSLGRIHWTRHNYEEARDLLEESEELRQQELGENDLGLVPVLNNLTNTYRSLGEFESAKAKALKSLRLVRLDPEATLGDIGKPLNNLAGLEKELGNYEAAVMHFQEALDLKQAFVDGLDEETSAWKSSLARSHSNLGSALHAQGQVVAAEDHFSEALDLLKGLEGQEKRKATVLKNYGALQRSQGDLSSATWKLRESLKIRRAGYPAKSRQMADILREVALLEQAKGEHAAAVDRLREVLDIQGQLYGAEHPEIGRSLTFLGFSLQALGDGAASESLRRARGILEASLPEDHPDLRLLDDVSSQAEESIPLG